MVRWELRAWLVMEEEVLQVMASPGELSGSSAPRLLFHKPLHPVSILLPAVTCHDLKNLEALYSFQL